MAGGRRIAAAACAGALALALVPRGAHASTCDTTYATLEACNMGVASGTNCTWDAEASKCGAGAPIEDGGFSVTTIGGDEFADCFALGLTFAGVMSDPACAAEYSGLQEGASVTAVDCQSGCIRSMLEATQAMIDAGCNGDGGDTEMPSIETLCGDDGASSDAPRGAQGATLAALAALAAAALAGGTTYPPGL